MVDILNQYFEESRKIFQEVLELKNCEGNNLFSKRLAFCLLFVAIKHSSRDVKYKIKDGREVLFLEKSKVDINRLQFQNLMYEVTHLRREITQCHKFKSRDSGIELLTENEYVDYGLAQSNRLEFSEHENHLIMLKYELNLRKRLSLNYINLIKSKEDIIQDIAFKTNQFISFTPALLALRESAKSLKNIVQLDLEKDWKFRKLIHFLPNPLYILFMNLSALESFVNVSLSIKINGSESEVIRKKIRTDQLKTYANADNNQNQDKESMSLEPHPLSVEFSIQNFERTGCFTVHVYFIKDYGFVTAHAEFCCNDLNEMGDELPSVRNVLEHLYANDSGDEIPISGVNYKLKGTDMEMTKCINFLKTNKFGKPYRWLQSVCGIHVLNNRSLNNNDMHLQENLRELIRKIERNCSSWTKLFKEIYRLSHKDVDSYAPLQNIFSSPLSCSLVQWSSVSYEEFCNHKPYIQNLLSGNDENFCSYFRAVIVRGSAKMECFIRITSSYPTVTPLWIICVYWNGHYSSHNCAAIKMMEYRTNSVKVSKRKAKYGVLYTQLYRALYGFDIFLETEGSLQKTIEYHKEKPYICAFSKRIRLRPYKFIKKGTVFFLNNK